MLPFNDNQKHRQRGGGDRTYSSNARLRTWRFAPDLPPGSPSIPIATPGLGTRPNHVGLMLGDPGRQPPSRGGVEDLSAIRGGSRLHGSLNRLGAWEEPPPGSS